MQQPENPALYADLQEVFDLVQEHNSWRDRCLNLVASENAYSTSLLSLLSGDLEQRYGNYRYRDTNARSYQGTKFVVEIESRVTALAERVFGATSIELRALSGQVAGAGILSGLCRPGDVIVELPSKAGGHRLAGRLVEAGLFDLRVLELPFDPFTLNVNVDAAVELIDTQEPSVIVLGSSAFLSPHPVGPLKKAMSAIGPDRHVVYDGSHVMGLIAGGEFHDPLGEGADILFGSTHKTLPGPQGGIILAMSEELMRRASLGVYPALVTNHHLARMPALAIALIEMELYGQEYASATIENARVLAEALSSHGFSLIRSGSRFTDSHTVVMRMETIDIGTAQEAAVHLEQSGIIVTKISLPDQVGGEGLRLGTQEITRLGAGRDDMETVASLIGRSLSGESATMVNSQVEGFVSQLPGLKYSIDGELSR